jgi:hypothetical protein
VSISGSGWRRIAVRSDRDEFVAVIVAAASMVLSARGYAAGPHSPWSY